MAPSESSLFEPIDCQIIIEGNTATLRGQFPLDVVKRATSYYAPNYAFSNAFKSGKWDGRKHLFNKQKSTVPAGLVPLIVETLEAYNPNDCKIEVRNANTWPAPKTDDVTLEGIAFGEGKYDYQKEALLAMLDAKRGIWKIATNGGKTSCAAALVKCLQIPTLFLVERVTLVNQTRERFSEYLGIPIKSIGKVGDGECFFGEWITVATPKSLTNTWNKEMADKWQLVIADECHRVGNNTFYNLLTKINAPWRVGMSGTPLSRSDGADLRLIAQTGPVVYRISNEFLVERGISVPPTVEIHRVFEPLILDKKLSYSEVEKRGIVENDKLNDLIANRAVELANEGKQVLVLVNIVNHGKTLIEQIREKLGETEMDQLMGKFSRAKFITGKSNSLKRDTALKNLQSGKINILVSTPILDEGVDVPNIDVLILGGGGKAKTKLLQRVGRGLRSGTGKKSLLIVDFANYTHKWHLKHSLQRLKLYKKENCFKIIPK